MIVILIGIIGIERGKDGVTVCTEVFDWQHRNLLLENHFVIYVVGKKLKNSSH